MMSQKVVIILLSMAAASIIDSTEATPCSGPDPTAGVGCNTPDGCTDSLREGDLFLSFNFNIVGSPTAKVTFTNSTQQEYFTFEIDPKNDEILLMKVTAAFKYIYDVGGIGGEDNDFRPNFVVHCAGAGGETSPYVFDPAIVIGDSNNHVPKFEGQNLRTISTNIDEWEEGRVINAGHSITLVDLDFDPANAQISPLEVRFLNNTVTDLVAFKDPTNQLVHVGDGRRHEKKIELVLKKDAPVGTHNIRLVTSEVVDSTVKAYQAVYAFDLVVNGASEIGAVLMVILGSIITTRAIL